jgi:DNA invertase Pin-like site-specific DNA recombinase
MTTQTAVGYVRVSTSMQSQDGVSLDAQEAKIRAWCSLNDYELIGLHIDAGLSGAKARNRPGLQAALNDCRKGSALVVYSLSRLSRSVRDTLDISDRLAKSGADLVSLSEKIDTTSAAGKMVFRMLSVMAEFEHDQIVERVKFGMDYKKEQGGRVGNIAYGYKLADDGDTLIEDEGEQEVIAAIHEYRDAGLSLRTIVTRLEERGFKSRTGTKIQLTQVARIVNG